MKKGKQEENGTVDLLEASGEGDGAGEEIGKAPPVNAQGAVDGVLHIIAARVRVEGKHRRCLVGTAQPREQGERGRLWRQTHLHVFARVE